MGPILFREDSENNPHCGFAYLLRRCCRKGYLEGSNSGFHRRWYGFDANRIAETILRHHQKIGLPRHQRPYQGCGAGKELQSRSGDHSRATGRREDHTLGNISLLAEYAQDCPFPVDMVTDHGIFHVIKDSTVFDAVPGKAISFFTFDQSLRIKSTGLEYPSMKWFLIPSGKPL